MARPAEPGRNNLLDAGMSVVDEHGLRGLSVNAVVSEAAMSKGGFYQHFPDRRSYIVALHRRYHDELAALVIAAVDDHEPGLDRLRTGIHAFLDATLRTRGTKAFLVQARTEADLLDEVQKRNSMFSELISSDLEAMGWPDASPIAHLVIAMVADISLQELYASGSRPELRRALLDLVIR
ncbi:TetR/AcrR family transcriptional regulator [Antrihabitans sp. YC3-6]|jgi:TetR/AcrR family transcriptional regulator, transcriptional repressor for nem operon|uniref:TetR/AcrR family transcriptional regulator n=1 Tax=Antrihabitans stalagmiti TaxID=2799499 RepID=A0A934U2P5_9NOCA|nr:TetR/AcrR family transcriptional regulator [Antrihabitans stalagmiti]MBJ8339150.1 TetR/AcrR family transcriptional regulator [Antrihabitans stalagmiti]